MFSCFFRVGLGILSLLVVMAPAACNAECVSGLRADSGGLCIGSERFNFQSSLGSNNLYIESNERVIVASVSCGEYWVGDKRRDRLRSEFQSVIKVPMGNEVSRSFSFRVDDLSDRAALEKGVVIAQFHATEDPGDFSGYPVFELVLKSGGIEVYSSSNADAMVSKPYPRVFRGGPYKVNIYEYVKVEFFLVFSYGGRGSVRLFLDGRGVLDLNQISIGHNDVVGPYFKFGVYTPDYECNSGFRVFFRDMI